MEFFKFSPAFFQNQNFNFQRSLLLLQLHSCDYFVCASERQRSFYLGLIADEKIIGPKNYFDNPQITSICSLLPFGLGSEPPESKNERALEEKYPAIKTGDTIVYWGGGIWNWFDPLSVVKAIEQISRQRSDIKLFFLGVKHPDPKTKEMEMAKKTLDYAKENNLLDKFVFFNFEWTPFNERVDYLKRATVGISTHCDNLETYLSFRTRILDYLWAELPMVVTKGDAMAELVEQHNLGHVVGYGDVEGIKQAILNLCTNETHVVEVKNNIKKIKSRFYWDNILSDLVGYIKNPDQALKKPIPKARYGKLILELYLSGVLKKLSH